MIIVHGGHHKCLNKGLEFVYAGLELSIAIRCSAEQRRGVLRDPAALGGM